MRALLNGVALADSDTTEVVEGNHYFPPETVRWEHLQPSETITRCPWKGKATWFHVRTGDNDVDDAAWTYRRPWLLARRIKNHISFGDAVDVVA